MVIETMLIIVGATSAVGGLVCAACRQAFLQGDRVIKSSTTADGETITAAWHEDHAPAAAKNRLEVK